MNKFFFFTGIVLIFFVSDAFCGYPVKPLVLHKALFVDGPENNQPSGLTLWQGILYTVSDKHDSTVFSIRLTSDTAVMEPCLIFNAPSIAEISYTQNYDFEGIATDSLGNFYLVSESFFRILRVSTDGKSASWITDSLKPQGNAADLFKTNNAYFEGIALTGQNAFILCAERQPRGFVSVDMSLNPPEVAARQARETLLEFPPGRSPDFSGLFYEENSLYVLERNAYAVTRMTVKNNRYEPLESWSYRHVVTEKAYRYADMKYGKAEGLCMDGNHVYVILDNNNIPTETYPDDRRPLLLILERPQNE